MNLSQCAFHSVVTSPHFVVVKRAFSTLLDVCNYAGFGVCTNAQHERPAHTSAQVMINTCKILIPKSFHFLLLTCFHWTTFWFIWGWWPPEVCKLLSLFAFLDLWLLCCAWARFQQGDDRKGSKVWAKKVRRPGIHHCPCQFVKSCVSRHYVVKMTCSALSALSKSTG